MKYTYAQKSHIPTYNMLWVNCCHIILLISCIHVVCFLICWLHTTVGSVGHRLLEKRTSVTQFTPPKIWKWQDVLLGIHAEKSSTNIPACLCVNLKTVQRNRKELKESDRTDEKSPPEFFGECSLLNTETCIMSLENISLPWVKRLSARRSYIWQNDTAPCHTSRIS